MHGVTKCFDEQGCEAFLPPSRKAAETYKWRLRFQAK